jgi:glyoxylase-like metal-dependent hydrolase (beta-lactamase superfamily II)
MVKKSMAVFGLIIFLSALPAAFAQDAKTVLGATLKAMGAENLNTLQFSGAGSNAGIGQNRNPNVDWPLVRVKSYRRELDLNAPASRVQMVRVQNNADQTQTQVILPAASWDTQYDIWLTPHGFLKGAVANNATVRPETLLGEKYNLVSYTVQNKYKVNGYVDAQNMLYKVETWVANDVLGDLHVEALYRDYKDFGGVKFPTIIIQKQAGSNTLLLIVDDVKPNAPVSIQPPAQTQAPAAPQPVTVQTEKVADGVFYLRGGSHHSVAVEFADHVAVIEAPLNEQRSLAVIAEVKKLIPNKAIRYLINTHHHFDHSGGLRTYVDEGATIVTHEVNKALYEKVLSAARTLNPDRLTQSKKAPRIETLKDKRVLSDATRTLELHHIVDNPHNDGILMAYLPKEQILVEVDVFTPPAANAPAPAAGTPPSPNTVNLVDNVEKLKLNVDKVLALHGPGVATKADLYRAAGKSSPSN